MLLPAALLAGMPEVMLPVGFAPARPPAAPGTATGAIRLGGVGGGGGSMAGAEQPGEPALLSPTRTQGRGAIAEDGTVGSAPTGVGSAAPDGVNAPPGGASPQPSPNAAMHIMLGSSPCDEGGGNAPPGSAVPGTTLEGVSDACVQMAAPAAPVSVIGAAAAVASAADGASSGSAAGVLLPPMAAAGRNRGGGGLQEVPIVNTIVALPGGDGVAVAVGAAFQAATDYHLRRPPLAA